MNVLSHFLIGCISITEEVGHLRQSEKIRSLQKIALLFLIGFFFGAIFYYFFQNSFEELMSQTEDSLSGWSRGEPYCENIPEGIYNLYRNPKRVPCSVLCIWEGLERDSSVSCQFVSPLSGFTAPVFIQLFPD